MFCYTFSLLLIESDIFQDPALTFDHHDNRGPTTLDTYLVSWAIKELVENIGNRNFSLRIDWCLISISENASV